MTRGRYSFLAGFRFLYSFEMNISSRKEKSHISIVKILKDIKVNKSNLIPFPNSLFLKLNCLCIITGFPIIIEPIDVITEVPDNVVTLPEEEIPTTAPGMLSHLWHVKHIN